MNFFTAICRCIWPLLAMVLGVVCGSIFGALITAVVFLLTLIRTPMHICKMLYVTATTTECFQGHLGWMMRIAVFLLVPAVHVLFLAAITAFSGTIGMLYYIGRTTKIFYKHEYKKTWKKIESNSKLEPTSYLGRYYKKCQKFMVEDSKSYGTIYFLKALVAIVPGTILGCLPLIPFALAIVVITLWRLPINAYKTMKIALFTVVLKWDLRIVALLTLPLVHLLFPLVTFVAALFGSFCYFVARTSRNIYKGYSPFHKWRRFNEGLEEYHKYHKDFVSERCGLFDHPSGIPHNWDGSSYGIPVRRILMWQWDLLMCAVFSLYAAPICFVGATLIAVIKFVPSVIDGWYHVTKWFCDQECVAIMAAWPFYVAGMCLLPFGEVLLYGLFILYGTCNFVRTPGLFPNHGYQAALYEPISAIGDLDELSSYICFKWRLFGSDHTNRTNQYATGSRSRRYDPNVRQEAMAQADAYWDRFISQCIRTTSELINTKWITLDKVEGIEPSVVQSIPAVAILTVLADSVQEKDKKEQLLKWTIDGTVCQMQHIPRDGITSQLLPMVVDIKKLLVSNKKKTSLATTDNVELLKALLCSNAEDDTDELKNFLKNKPTANTNDKTMDINKKIRTKINSLVLAILQVRPYRNRMGTIYSHEYQDDRGTTCSHGCGFGECGDIESAPLAQLNDTHEHDDEPTVAVDSHEFEDIDIEAPAYVCRDDQAATGRARNCPDDGTSTTQEVTSGVNPFPKDALARMEEELGDSRDTFADTEEALGWVYIRND